MRTIYVTKSPKAALNVSLFGKVDSTNNVIRNDINYGHFDFVIAEMQTHGRGRGDNVFISEMGGLYMSVLLEDDGEMTDYITPLAGVAVAKTLIEYGFEPRIKWVNDVFVHVTHRVDIFLSRSTQRSHPRISFRHPKAPRTLSHQTFQLLTRTLREIGFKRGWKSLIHD